MQKVFVMQVRQWCREQLPCYLVAPEIRNVSLAGLHELHRGEVGNAKSQEVVEQDGVEALP